MKRLTILRHAKSQPQEPRVNDFDRPLNDRGWNASRRMGSELEERNFRFDRILVSPAARARETIAGVQQGFEFAAPIRLEQRLYLAQEALLLSIVRELPETVKSPLLVGHNPGLQQLLLAVATEDPAGLRHRISHKFPTGAVAVVQLPDHPWKILERKSGIIVELIEPSELV